MGLDMGHRLGNLGNTCISAGFDEEVRDTYSGLDVTGASVDESQEANSVISNNGPWINFGNGGRPTDMCHV